MAIYAMVTDQGTAASETALCGEHFTPENKDACVIGADDDVIIHSWKDCTGNDALRCNICGRKQ